MEKTTHDNSPSGTKPGAFSIPWDYVEFNVKKDLMVSNTKNEAPDEHDYSWSRREEALNFVKEANFIAMESQNILLLRDSTSTYNNLAVLVERLFHAQNEFRKLGNGVPYHVDIAYHSTLSENLKSIEAQGLLSRREREEKNIYVKSNGSFYGDGVYCSTNPSSIGNGDTMILLARLKGAELRVQGAELFHNVTTKGSFYHTKAILKTDACVLQNGYQCVPLFSFSSKLLQLADLNQDSCFLYELAEFHETVQRRLLDRWFNDGAVTMDFNDPSVFPGKILSQSTPNPNSIRSFVNFRKNTESKNESQSPVAMQNVKMIENCNSITDLKRLLFYLKTKTPADATTQQLSLIAQKRLKTIRYHASVTNKLRAVRTMFAAETDAALKSKLEVWTYRHGYLPDNSVVAMSTRAANHAKTTTSLAPDASNKPTTHSRMIVEKKELERFLQQLKLEPSITHSRMIVGKKVLERLPKVVDSCHQLQKRADTALQKGDIHLANCLYTTGLNQLMKLRNVQGTFVGYTGYSQLSNQACSQAALFYRQRALTFLQQLKLEPSINDCDQSLRLDPKHEKTYIQKWMALDGMGKNHEAISCLMKGQKEIPKSDLLRHKLADARALYNLGASSNENSDANNNTGFLLEQVRSLKRRADFLLSKGNILAPRSLYSDAVKCITQHKKGSVDYTEELRLLLSELYSNRSVTYYRSKEYSKSLEDCNTSLSLNQRFEKTYIRKASVLKAMGESTQKSLECLGIGLTMLPDSTMLLRQYQFTLEHILASAIRALKRGDLSGARTLCDEGIGWLLCSKSDDRTKVFVKSCLASFYDVRSMVLFREGESGKSLRDRDHCSELKRPEDTALASTISQQDTTKQAKTTLGEWDLLPEADSLLGTKREAGEKVGEPY